MRGTRHPKLAFPGPIPPESEDDLLELGDRELRRYTCHLEDILADARALRRPRGR